MSGWHSRPLAELERELATDFSSGLSMEEARRRQASTGFNELPPGKTESLALIFIRQFQSPLIYILGIAGVIVYVMGEIVDAWLIGIVLVFNAVIGTIQEGRAENTLAALRKFVETRATILRDGKDMIVADREVVPGDVIILQEGERVPADARIFEASTLRVDEAALTGESIPVHKEPGIIQIPNASLPAQTNMVFKGTGIASGRGKAVVVATGTNSIIGGISKAVAEIDTEIPLKRDIRALSQGLIVVVCVIGGAIFFLGLQKGRPIEEMFSTAISLVISIIPEGLPVVLTLILASGVWRMAKRNALVKKLHAVEALGQAQVIAVDKTGTLTKNEMIIRKIFVAEKTFEIGGLGYEPRGDARLNGEAVNPPNHPELLMAGRIAALSAGAKTLFVEEAKVWRVSGDPTEAAMLVFGEKMGFRKEDAEREMAPLAEIPFDYHTKLHIVSNANSDRTQFLSVTGAPESVLRISKKILGPAGPEHLTDVRREVVEKMLRDMSLDGLRVVAFAYRDLPFNKALTADDLVFGGLYGIEDTLRPEVPDAMQKAHSAGIKVVMITGDSKLTAIAIAKEAGIWQEGDEVVTDDDLEKLSEPELDRLVGAATVFARITPEHKMQVVQAYKRRGEIIAMTGDGVNDAPSLVAADLGVAMGRIGTEVAKEAADIILLDDNFGSIVSAVEEGRSMYATIQKTLLFLFSTSIGEVLVIGGALLAGFPLPLLAAQILWLNLVTDSFIAFALAMDNKDKSLLAGKFIHPSKYLVDRTMLWRMVVMAVPMGLGTLYLFAGAHEADITKAWTLTLTAAAMFQWLNGWNCRSETASAFHEPFQNKYLVAALFVTLGLQIFAIYNPFMQKLLHLTPLSLYEWGIVTATCFSIIFAEEVRKFISRTRKSMVAARAKRALLASGN